MTIEQILTELYNYSRRNRCVPRVRDRGAARLFKEIHRKIGSGRKALFVAGVIANERARTYPQLLFSFQGGGYRLDRKSREALQGLVFMDSRRKERMA